MKKTLVALLSLIMVFALCACGGSSEPEEAQPETIYKVGDTWTVDGQWSLTIDSVEATNERNEFEETQPAQVVKINYHYENIGYEDETGLMDGLFLDLGSCGQVVDAEGNVCTEYPLGDVYAQETPVGAKCQAESYFGLIAEGSPIKLSLSQYDGNGDEQKAAFELAF